MAAINSLANIGIPGLNGDRSAVLQPILSNRFRVVFYNFGNNGEIAPYDMTRQVRSINRPTLTFETQTLYSYVSTVYINTRAEWSEINIRLLDDITNSVMSRVQQQCSKQMNFFDQTMARAGENYKFELDLDILAGGASAGRSAADPNRIQHWTFAGCQLTTSDPGEMTYESAQGVEINLTIRFDNCIVFNHLGVRMGTFSHASEIAGRRGIASTGTGSGGLNIGGFNIGL